MVAEAATVVAMVDAVLAADVGADADAVAEMTEMVAKRVEAVEVVVVCLGSVAGACLGTPPVLLPAGVIAQAAHHGDAHATKGAAAAAALVASADAAAGAENIEDGVAHSATESGLGLKWRPAEVSMHLLPEAGSPGCLPAQEATQQFPGAMVPPEDCVLYQVWPHLVAVCCAPTPLASA
mmetsp:Transcript_82943/g.182309  ORF Transcript_82943/g.182309 Transcript_82943/m.182309 type:complete len:180 (+) Transcript_82943:657-1196(+)